MLQTCEISLHKNNLHHLHTHSLLLSIILVNFRIIFLSGAGSSVNHVCPSEMPAYCYAINTSKMKWVDASSYCQHTLSPAGHVVSIHSQTEENVVLNLISLVLEMRMGIPFFNV